MNIITKYFDGLSDQQLEQFARLGTLYEEWNAKINVISRKDIEQLYERHVLHSMAIAKVISFPAGSSILDVGTGGGFPGIPLSLLFPESSFTLIDSIGKKIKVVEEVASALGLQNVRGRQVRVEELTEKFDFIVSRAVTAFPRFVALTRSRVKNGGTSDFPNGILYLKGGDFNDELKLVAGQVKIYNLSQFFEEEFFETKRLIYMPIKNK